MDTSTDVAASYVLKIWLKSLPPPPRPLAEDGSVGERWRGSLVAPVTQAPWVPTLVTPATPGAGSDMLWDERLARPHAGQGPSSHCIVSTGVGRTGAQESGCPEPGGSCACPTAELSSVFLRPCLLIGEIVTERCAHCLHIASLSSLFCKPQGEATASLDCLSPLLAPSHTHTSHQNVSMYGVCRAL